MPERIVPNLWFDTQAEEAAEFYCSVFPSSRIVGTTRFTEAGPREAGMVMSVDFELDGNRFVAINGGPEFTFDDAVSFAITCEDQDEIDYYWERLTDGGEEGPCGWLTDRFGVSWQIVPLRLKELLSDATVAPRVMRAMFAMKKLDIAGLEAAAAGETAAV
jgi:predicted 3-demethylubiquinone-9 3-methyltransferase (glyoxalase superfamily)